MEEEHIIDALTKCGYPKWPFKKVKKQMAEKMERRKEKRKKDQDQVKSKGLVSESTICSVTEGITRILNKHKVATAVKPIQKIKNLLLHPKDKVEISKKCEVVYKTPCGSCEKVYIGEP